MFPRSVVVLAALLIPSAGCLRVADNRMSQADEALNRGEWDRAVEILTDLLETNPDNGEAYGKRGLAFAQKWQLERALADFADAIQLDDKKTWYRTARGGLFARLGDFDRAIEDFTAAIELDDTDASAFAGRGGAYANKGKLEEALADFDQARNLGLDDATFHVSRGVACQRSGRYQEAADEFNAALGQQQGSPLVLNGLAWLLATCKDDKIRDGQKALQLAKQACDASAWRDCLILDTLAAAYAECGKFDDAVQMQLRALKGPGWPADQIEGGRRRLHLYEQHEPYRE